MSSLVATQTINPRPRDRQRAIAVNPWLRFAAQMRGKLIREAKAARDWGFLRHLRREEAEEQHELLLAIRPPTRPRPRRQVVPMRSLRHGHQQYTRRNLSSGGEDSDAQ
jgi:hypothetical protein